MSLFVFDTMLKKRQIYSAFSIKNNNLVKFNTMKIQKRAAWYRLPSWHRQSIVPALMPCSNGAWRFLPLPDRARLKNKKARNYAGLADFYAIKCLAVPDAGSFPLYCFPLCSGLIYKGFITICGIRTSTRTIILS
ncbi:hypothetical protein ACFO3A_00760 [Comamonas nitrativorans]|uniref:Uncharacterized protein n=1 Tax=Comamonas nitrativorans TaxID=108437 RepID=A0ABV9GUP6_9BURK